MSLEAKLALAALVVAVVAVPIAAWVTRQYGTRRKKLLFLFEATSLMPVIKGSAADALKITYHDVPVDDPHLLTIRLENIGPSDIASNHFDSDKPVQVRLNSTLYGMLSATQPEHTVGPAMGTADAVIELTPLLFKRKDTWVVELLVSGDPKPELVSSLVDTDVVAQTVADRLGKASQRTFIDMLDALVSGLVGPGRRY
ncbi:hypothetical protein ACFOWZ_07335 [Lentzea rhizosphaerae]|uniref:Secreted protein n=1 Tax=Lentzea rhizosphaerae TaxID=2041025 RepID=A0ABV8BPQ0_9PSEU